MKIFKWFVIVQLFIVKEFCLCDFQTIQNVFTKTLRNFAEVKGKCSDEQYEHVPVQDDDLQTLMEKLFKKLKEIVIKNDIFHYGYVTSFDKDGYGLILRGSGGNFLVQGISSMNVTHLVATHDDVLHFELQLELGEIQLTGFYNFTFDILTMLPLFGAGDFGLIVPSLRLNVTIALQQTNSGILQISESNLSLDILKFEVDFENLLGNKVYSKLITDIINDIAEDLTRYDKYLMSVLNIIVKSQINKALCSYVVTYDKMIDAITHFIQ